MLDIMLWSKEGLEIPTFIIKICLQIIFNVIRGVKMQAVSINITLMTFLATSLYIKPLQQLTVEH